MEANLVRKAQRVGSRGDPKGVHAAPPPFLEIFKTLPRLTCKTSNQISAMPTNVPVAIGAHFVAKV